MNWDRIEGKWDEYKGRIKQKWAKLTDDDLALIGGKKDELVGKVKERYGLAKDKAEAQIDEWTRSIGDRDDDSPSYPPTGSGNNRGSFGGGMQAAGREGDSGSGSGGAGSGGAGGREGGQGGQGGQGGRENSGREGQDKQGQGGQRDQGGQGGQGGQPGRGGQEPGNRPDPNRDAVREPKKG